ncbi:MAG: FAD-dependent monooxygenase, partial [Alphaproteobacteria bacterium]|nr:FAD-dependent monooxygenase [Alphaproteobacteria bacterium]
WQGLSTNSQPINQIRIVDGDVVRGASPLTAHFDQRAIGLNTARPLYPEMEKQPFGVIVENRFLRHTLINRLSTQKNIHLFENTRIEKKNEDERAVQITLGNGVVLSAPLLVVAEGKGSQAAKEISDFSETHYQQTALVMTVKAERDHQGVAVEHFYPHGPFAMLPMTDGRVNVVWTETPTMANKLLALPADDLYHQLVVRFGDWLGKIEIIGQVFSYPLAARHARHYSRGRLLLLADAAHSIHPIAGQGFNLGLKDIIALTNILTRTKNQGGDSGGRAVMEQYQQARWQDNQNMLRATDALNRLFSTDRDWLTALRRLGLFGFDQLRFIKQRTVNHAMGL